MAKNKQLETKDGKKAKGPAKKPGLGARIRQFIAGLKSELKRVVWPDKKTMKQTAIAVAIVIMLCSALVFIVDSILGASLRAAGFDTPNQELGQPADDAGTTEPSNVTIESEASETTTEGTTAAGEE